MQRFKLLLPFLFSQICLNTSNQLQQAFAPTIALSYGSIRGIVLSTDTSTNQETFAYLGVPFVHPPINELRFKPPKSIDGNSEVCSFKIYTRVTKKTIISATLDRNPKRNCLRPSVSTKCNIKEQFKPSETNA